MRLLLIQMEFVINLVVWWALTHNYF